MIIFGVKTRNSQEDLVAPLSLKSKLPSSKGNKSKIEFGEWSLHGASDQAMILRKQFYAHFARYTNPDSTDIPGIMLHANVDFNGLVELLKRFKKEPEVILKTVQNPIDYTLYDECKTKVLSGEISLADVPTEGLAKKFAGPEEDSSELVSLLRGIGQNVDEFVKECSRLLQKIRRLYQWDIFHRFNEAKHMRLLHGTPEPNIPSTGKNINHQYGAFYTQCPLYSVDYAYSTEPKILVVDIPVKQIVSTSWLFFPCDKPTYEPEVQVEGNLKIVDKFILTKTDDLLEFIDFSERYKSCMKQAENVDQRDLEKIDKTNVDFVFYFLFCLEKEFRDLCGDENIIGKNNLDKFRSALNRVVKKSSDLRQATEIARKLIDDASIKPTKQLGSFLDSQYIA